MREPWEWLPSGPKIRFRGFVGAHLSKEPNFAALNSFFHCGDKMATRGNSSGNSIAESSTDLRAMIEDPDHESVDEDPATLDNGKFSYLPLAQLSHQKNRPAAAS